MPPSWQRIVQSEIQKHSSDSQAFSGGRDLFFSSEGIGKGSWGLRQFAPTAENVDLTEDDTEFPEGKKKLRQHVLRERNPNLVFEAKKRFKNRHGRLFCEVCKFVFAKRYGAIGEDFIEAHHIKPVSELSENEKTKISDLVMVCSNCHRMLHRRRPWLEKGDLESLLVSKK